MEELVEVSIWNFTSLTIAKSKESRVGILLVSFTRSEQPRKETNITAAIQEKNLKFNSDIKQQGIG